MNVQIFNSKQKLGQGAAADAARIIRQAITEHGRAYLIAATGASQFEFLDALVREPNIDWTKTTFFHLDEYVGLPESHPASFRKYLKERIVDLVHPGIFHFVNGNAPNPTLECRRLGELIATCTIDAAFVGIGENGHLAFNDPPADFDTEEPYIVVQLDEGCRRQQLGEGWFSSLEQVPRTAISMSIRQILKSENILCIVPDKRKDKAVKDSLEGEVGPSHPASVLQQHPHTTIYLDTDSVSLLRQSPDV